MDKLMDLIKFVTGEGRAYIKRVLIATRHPARSARFCRTTTREVLSYLTISSVLVAILHFPQSRTYPALLQTASGWVILLPTARDREQVLSVGYQFGVVSLLDTVGMLLCLLIAMTLSTWFLARRSVRRRTVFGLARRLALPIMASVLVMGISSASLYWVGNSDLVPNWLFVVFGIAGLSFWLYGAFWIKLVAVRSVGRMRVWRAVPVFIVAEVCTVLLLVLFSLGTYQIQQSYHPEPGLTHANELLMEAEEQIAIGRYDNTITFAREALASTPHNLDAETLYLRGQFLRFATDALDYLDSLDARTSRGTGTGVLAVDSLIVHRLRSEEDTLRSSLNAFTKAYADIPSVQLFSAEHYSDLGECSRARAAYLTALRHPAALPHERMLALRGVENIDSAGVYNISRTERRWAGGRGITGLLWITRLIAATPPELRMELMVADIATGGELEMQASILPEIAMASHDSRRGACNEGRYIDHLLKSLSNERPPDSTTERRTSG